jgi:amidase
MSSSDLAFTSALEQARLIRSGEISPFELTELYLQRIEVLNPQLGSFFTVAAEFAIAQAREQTQLLAQRAAQSGDRQDLPPFFGVPIAIKDLNLVEGLPVTYGVAALNNNIAAYDDGVVAKIKQAGFVILGKTATSQLGLLPYSEPLGFAPARNPWHLDHTPGGSSGGSAAAVAAGLCALAQGSDGGGSIRGPASACGVVGLKPSRGRVTNAPVGDYQSGIASHGPLARTVADTAALLDVLSGYVTGDPYWLPAPDLSFLAQTQLPPPKQLRIAFATTVHPFQDSDPLYQNAVNSTVKCLDSLGHQLESACPDVSALIEPFKTIWQSGVGAARIPLAALDPFNQWLGAQPITAGEYLQAVQQMQVISRSIVAFFEQYEVLILPVYRHLPPAIGAWAALPPEETLGKIIDWIAPCPLVNATGLPAIALPAGFDDESGLPVGIQLIGRPASEALLLRLAALLEIENPWQQHRPPLAVF